MQTSAIIGHLNELFKIANSTYPVGVSRSVRNQYNASGEYVMAQLRSNGVWCVSTPRSAKGRSSSTYNIREWCKTVAGPQTAILRCSSLSSLFMRSTVRAMQAGLE